MNSPAMDKDHFNFIYAIIDMSTVVYVVLGLFAFIAIVLLSRASRIRGVYRPQANVSPYAIHGIYKPRANVSPFAIHGGSGYRPEANISPYAIHGGGYRPHMNISPYAIHGGGENKMNVLY